MKRVYLIITFLSCSFCLSAQPSEVTADDFSKLQWLEGIWSRTDVKPGNSAREIWTKSSADEYTGLGVSMEGHDTTFVERLRIEVKDGSIFYVADVPENPQPVYFRFTSLADSAFACENPDHDFPKKISYVLEGSMLTATISGDGKEISFAFLKLQ